MSSIDTLLGHTRQHLHDFTPDTLLMRDFNPNAGTINTPNFQQHIPNGFNSGQTNHTVNNFATRFGDSWMNSRASDANRLVGTSGSGSSMRFTSEGNLLENTQQRLRAFDRSKDMAERFSEGPGGKTYQDMLKKAQKDLTKDAHKAYSLMEKAEAAHGKAVAEIAKRQEAVVSDMMKAHRKAWESSMKIANVDARVQYQEALEHTMQARMDFLEHHFGELRKPHESVLEHIAETRADLIEKSGIAPKAKSALATAENKAVQSAEQAAEGGMFSRLSKNLHETPMKTGAATLLGGGAVVIGGKALAQDIGLLERPKGPDGEPQQGNFLMDAAITAGGLAALAYAMRSGKGAAAAMAH